MNVADLRTLLSLIQSGRNIEAERIVRDLLNEAEAGTTTYTDDSPEHVEETNSEEQPA